MTINWDKVKHISEGGVATSAPSLNLSKIKLLGTGPSSPNPNKPIDWDNVRHISEVNQPPVSTTPTGEMTFRPDIEQRLLTESPSVMDTARMLQRTMPVTPVKTQTSEEEQWFKDKPILNFLANNPVSTFISEKIVPFTERIGSTMRRTFFGGDPYYTTGTGEYKPPDVGKVGNIAADILGTIEGYALPAGGPGSSSVLSASRKIGEKAVEKLAPKLPTILQKPLAQRVMQGMVEDVPLALYSGAVEKQKPEEILKNLALQAPFTIGGEAALYGLGKGFRGAINRAQDIAAAGARGQAATKNLPLKQTLEDTLQQDITTPKPKEEVEAIANELRNLSKPQGLEAGQMVSGYQPPMKYLNEVLPRQEGVRMKPRRIYEAQSIAPEIRKFTIKTDDTGPAKVFDTTKITDGQGKSLYEAMTPDHKELYDTIVKDLEGAQVKPDTEIQQIAQNIKDKSGFSYNMKDVYRNFKDAFGKHYDTIKKKILDPFDNAKKSFVDMQKKYTDDLYENVVKKLGMGKDTNESAAIQWFGEGVKPAKVTDPQTGRNVWGQVKYTLDDLKREFPNKWEKIVEADKWFRQKYNELIDQVNASRIQIYPNNPEKLVPYRKDYYRHFREMADGIQGVKNLFETPSQIDPSLAGVSEFTKPKSRWASFMQKRGLGKYKADAVGGFLDYIKAASYATHIDPQISVFRGLAKDIAEGTAKTRNANGFIKYLQDFANDLAGKTNPADRWLQDNIPGGRTTFRIINWINSRVKANTVLGNISSSLSQIANIPQGIAYVKNPVHITKGAGNFMASIFDAGHAKLYKKSQFLSERFSQRLFSRFDTKMLDYPKRFAAWMLGALDEVGTKFIWSSTYNKAIAEGIQNPIKYADDVARRMVAGRGIGEMPLLQKSKIFQLVAPFQVEVGNLWHVMKDFVSEKDFGGLAILFVANYLLNKGMEELRGSGVTFDPIGAIEDALKEEGTTPLQKAGRLGGEILSNIPLGQTVATILPEDMRKQFFGREDPTRYGTSLLAIKGLQDPLYKLALPFGGSQLKKTIEAQRALNKGGVYGKTKEGEEYLKYPVEQTTGSKIKGALFGTGAFPETREYYSSNQRPLGVNQTIVAQQTGLDPKELHKGTLLKRKFETARDKGETLKPIKEEIMNYYNETGDILVFMEDSPQRTFTFDIPGTDEKRKVELTQEQYTEYVRKVLQYARQQVNYAKSFDSYRIASTEKKYEFLRKAVSKAETKAKKELLNQLK